MTTEVTPTSATEMARAQPAPMPPAITTPQILKSGIAGIGLASLLLMVAAIAGARSYRHAIQVVGKDAAPSMVAAEHIQASLADMDADAANELLRGKDGAAGRQAFEQRRTETISAIVAAAENITYGDAERGPIRKLALGVGTYTAGIQTARDRHEAGDKNFLASWREAARFLDSTLLPAAAELDQANRKALEETYLGQKSTSRRALVFLIFAGLTLGTVLFLLQIFLLLRMRRILNPMLFLATMATLVFVVYAGQRFGASDRDLKVAKEDAFDSIHTLWQARAMAYSANSDESRYLLDPGQAAVYEKNFQAKASQISNGFLADEMKNITFEGEREAGRNAVLRFSEYSDIDKQIRILEKSGRHEQAIALCTGNGRGQSNHAFGTFDEALAQTLDLNQRAFDAAVARGFGDVAAFEITAPGVALLISVLGWLGLRGRIREYEG